MFKTMVDALREEGEARGIEKGKVEGEQKAVLRLLHLKFGELPPEVVQRVQAIRSLERLEDLLEQVWAANSLKDIRWRTAKKQK